MGLAAVRMLNYSGPSMAEYVCPECGTTAGSQPFCGNCGLNISKLNRLPTREAWELENGESIEGLPDTERPSPSGPNANPDPHRRPDEHRTSGGGCGGCGGFLLALTLTLAVLSWVTGIGPVRDNIACAFDTDRKEAIVRERVEEYQAAVADGDFNRACEMVDSPVFARAADVSGRDVDEHDVCVEFLEGFGRFENSVEAVQIDGNNATVQARRAGTLRLTNDPSMLSFSQCDWKIVDFAPAP